MEATKKGKLRAINQGTRYDVAGSIKKIGRRVDRGDFGDVRNAVIAMQTIRKNRGVEVTTFHFGPGDIAQALYLIESAKGQIVSS